MRIHALWATVFAFCLVACGEQQQPPQPAVEPPVAAPAEEPGQAEVMVDKDFIEHMHGHAKKMDEIMFALADGDLDAAMTPAFWLGRHESVAGLPDDLQQYLIGMREGARAVERATDIDTARAAAEGITTHCQGCHAAAGIVETE